MKRAFPFVFAAALIFPHLGWAQEHLRLGPASQRIDGTLFTTYSRDTNDTTLGLTVCGSTQNTEGCYGSASLGPFGKIGAILESNPQTDLSTNTVTRSIYVVDSASGTSQNGVTLFVYTKTDAITPDFDTVTVTLSKTVALPLTGGLSARTSMAANTQFLFVGTSLTAQGVELNKRTLTPVLVGGFSPPINVSAITADQYGYVTITFGSFNGGESGFYLFGPDGSGQEDGGGADFTVGTTQAVLPGGPTR